MKKIGRYEIRKSIAKGGMGEVFLAYDPLCEREIALKCIREELADNPLLQERFLKEAKITAQLTHPGIIAIYSIHDQSKPFYYTMPYIEGKTLRQLLQSATADPKKHFSIVSMMPLFKNLCQTMAYAHAQGILHRDIKPENILVGKYGEVILLDWGVSTKIAHEEESLDIETDEQLTRPGKIVGTLPSLAPERMKGQKASVQSDIYALGVILYQILTLTLPFHRRSLKEFKKQMQLEKLIPPEEKAPYRDVPLRLSKIVQRTLEVEPQKRYQNIEALLEDLRGYFEGSADWFEEGKLSLHRSSDWEFQENVLISKNLALTSIPEASGWINMMVSKEAFSENIRIKTRIKIGAECAGVGFLLSVPESEMRKSPLDGFCLWLGSKKSSYSQLLRNTIEVMRLPSLTLECDQWHTLIIEKQDEKLYFKLDNQAGFTYISYLPLLGRQLGILSIDHNFVMEEIILFAGSKPLKISCLSIPNAFLANRQFKLALEEYRRIGHAFPGHAEGREALFRAGIVLLEQAKAATTAADKEYFYNLASTEFSKLHTTPGAPYEYLGKALVAETLEDFSEEIKYLELGLRRYHKHPLKHVLQEQIIYRMHESAQMKRVAAYQLVTLVARLMPEALYKQDTALLLKELTEFWEPLYFIENPVTGGLEKTEYEKRLLISLNFWLSAPYLLQEQLGKVPIDISMTGDILFSLFEMGADRVARQLLKELNGKEKIIQLLYPLDMPLNEGILFFTSLKIKEIGIPELRTLLFLMHRAIDENQMHIVEKIITPFLDLPLPKEMRILLDCARIWAFLKSDDTEKAEKIFDVYSYELLNQESTLLHPLYGCYLLATENEEIARLHFAGVIETPFPRSWALLGHQITNNILRSPHWFPHSFAWERHQLYRQLELFYTCGQNSAMKEHFAKLLLEKRF